MRTDRAPVLPPRLIDDVEPSGSLAGGGSVPAESSLIVKVELTTCPSIELPGPDEVLRLELCLGGYELGVVDLHHLPGVDGGDGDAVVERWLREEALPHLLPGYVKRNAWCNPRLARSLVIFASERGTLAFLWDLLHTRPRLWRRRLSAYLGVRADALLRLRRGTGAAAGQVGTLAAAPGPTVWDRARWERLFDQPDPWGYTSPYEQRKYEHTLAVLPERPIQRALELACAEGHFTVLLAPRVGELVAADIAQQALDRARERCAAYANVSYVQLDLRKQPVPGRFDLIVCSEVLYFVGNRFGLSAVARKLADALEPGGHLLMAHANVVVDDASSTGFEWAVGFGAKAIGETFSRLPSLEFVRELRTPVYRVQLFRRRARSVGGRQVPREVIQAATADLGGLVASLDFGGCAISRSEAAHSWTTRQLPILMYHRIAHDGPEVLAPWRVSPETFERQLAYLRRHGYTTITLDRWIAALRSGEGRVPGRAVVLTFDDAYRDFLTAAWPLLRRYGFTATVFVVSDHVGGRAEWDQAFGEPAELASWDELRELASEGVELASHSGSHPFLTRLDLSVAMAEGLRSRERMEQELGRPIVTMSYPFGDQNLLVRRAMAACGYAGAVTAAPGLSRLGDNPMALPRQIVLRDDDLDSFVAKLGAPERASWDRRLRFRYHRWAGTNLL
jgi:peptidoglycan/xylan/chitin deacetylase (PgdA/CDA1 family)/2-polyprenyl-3-methyl-5-hydroxy-6-metoxy-1,4-benzoquinol methylase